MTILKRQVFFLLRRELGGDSPLFPVAACLSAVTQAQMTPCPVGVGGAHWGTVGNCEQPGLDTEGDQEASEPATERVLGPPSNPHCH